MAIKYDEARIEVDWLADFAGWRTLKLQVKFTDENDPLLKAILERHQQEVSAYIIAERERGAQQVLFM